MEVDVPPKNEMNGDIPSIVYLSPRGVETDVVAVASRDCGLFGCEVYAFV